MGNDTFQVRIAGHGDLDLVAGLLQATDRHYWGVRDGAEAAARQAAEAILHGRSGCQMLIGWLGGAAVTYATFAILHPSLTEHGTLYMKDLFVLDGARGKGLGALMMRRVAGLAVERGCVRFDWTTQADNPGAVAFYDRLSAERVTKNVYFRLAGTDLARFAGGGTDG